MQRTERGKRVLSPESSFVAIIIAFFGSVSIGFAATSLTGASWYPRRPYVLYPVHLRRWKTFLDAWMQHGVVGEVNKLSWSAQELIHLWYVMQTSPDKVSGSFQFRARDLRTVSPRTVLPSSTTTAPHEPPSQSRHHFSRCVSLKYRSLSVPHPGPCVVIPTSGNIVAHDAT